MAPFTITHQATQPYSQTSDLHPHMFPTDHVITPYTGAAIPFGRVERQKAAERAAQLGADYRPEREPKAPAGWRTTPGFKTTRTACPARRPASITLPSPI